ncbi:pentapeptide repeat-containing protein [Rhodococcus wratislaviensis]|uniref:pentapeptide repeat-containing protein n=1 Tax=Rhodococcus wratislaviensis TaxID=44752 RepID=UPI0004B3B730|nr:pentapeptide repeat-containing protein [Rhodococcus wratislaviensis]
MSERFGKAVEQLGSEQQELRLGGIYSLEQLAHDSPDDHWTAFEVLVAFVRSHAPLDQRCVPADKVPGEVAAISIDLQAVLTVVGRRTWQNDRGLVDLARTCLVDADLSSSHLAFAYLYNANLTGANLIDADLSDANLTGAELTGAELTGADLADAELFDATLTGADLTGADLAADLHGTDLTGARLRDANLTGAQLNSANLIGVTLAGAVLTGVTLDGALYDSTTSWPEGYTSPR